MEIDKSHENKWLKVLVLFLITIILTACVPFAHEPIDDDVQIRYLNQAGEALQEDELTGTFTVWIPLSNKEETAELYIEQDGISTLIEEGIEKKEKEVHASITIKETGEYRFLVKIKQEETSIKEEASHIFQVHELSSLFSWQMEDAVKFSKDPMKLSFQRAEAVETTITMVQDQERVPLAPAWEDGKAQATFDQEGTWYMEVQLSYHNSTWMIAYEDLSFTIDHTSPKIMMEYENKNLITEHIGILSEPAQIKLSIQEKYLHMEDLIFQVNGTTKPLTWKQDKDMAYASWRLDQEGTYQLSLCAVDEAGNKNCVTALPLVYDATASTIQILMDGSEITTLPAYINHEITLTVQVEDDHFDPINSIITDQGTTCPGTWIQTEQQWTYSITLTEGSHEIQITAFDLAQHSTNKLLETIIDIQAPVVHLQYELLQAYRDDVPISFQIEDQNLQWKDSFLTLKQDDQTVSLKGRFQKTSKGGSYELRIKEEGNYEVSLHVFDLAGNEAVYVIDDTNQSSFTHKFYIDRTRPHCKVSFSKTTEHGFYASPRTMNLQIQETHMDPHVAFVTLHQDQKEQELTLIWTKSQDGYTSEITVSEDGVYEINMDLYDQAGNHAVYEIEGERYETFPVQSFVMDQTSPVISLTKSKEGSYSNEAVQISTTVEETYPALVQLRVMRDGELYQEKIRHDEVQEEFELKAQDEGQYHIVLEAYDQAGNHSMQELEVTIDATPPDLMTRFNAFPAQQQHEFITNQDTIIESTWKDLNLKQGHAILRKDGQEQPIAQDANGIHTTLYANDAAETNYELELQAVDLAGNISNATYHLRIDTYLPTLELDSDPFLGKPKNLSWIPSLKQEDDAFRVTEATLYKNQMLVPGYHWKDEISDEGSYMLALTVRDDAMNEATLLPPFSFVIDKTAPTIRIEEDSKQEELVDDTVSLSTKLRIYVHDEVTIQPNIKVLSLDDQAITEDQLHLDEDQNPYYLISFTDAKPTTLLVQVSDEAGNETKESITFQVSDQITKEEVKTIPKPLQKAVNKESNSMSNAIWAGLCMSGVLFLWVVKRYVH